MLYPDQFEEVDIDYPDTACRVPFDGTFAVANCLSAPDKPESKKTLEKQLKKEVKAISLLQRQLYAQDRFSLLLVLPVVRFFLSSLRLPKNSITIFCGVRADDYPKEVESGYSIAATTRKYWRSGSTQSIWPDSESTTSIWTPYGRRGSHPFVNMKSTWLEMAPWWLNSGSTSPTPSSAGDFSLASMIRPSTGNSPKVTSRSDNSGLNTWMHLRVC